MRDNLLHEGTFSTAGITWQLLCRLQVSSVVEVHLSQTQSIMLECRLKCLSSITVILFPYTAYYSHSAIHLFSCRNNNKFFYFFFFKYESLQHNVNSNHLITFFFKFHCISTILNTSVYSEIEKNLIPVAEILVQLDKKIKSLATLQQAFSIFLIKAFYAFYFL